MITYDYDRIGDVLREVRNANNLTQRQMAEILDISHIHYSKIEQGERKICVDLMIKVIDIFHVDANQFFGITKKHGSGDIDEMLENLRKLDKTGKRYIISVWKEILNGYMAIKC